MFFAEGFCENVYYLSVESFSLVKTLYAFKKACKVIENEGVRWLLFPESFFGKLY